MVFVKQSPTNQAYLIGIKTPQAVELELRKLISILEQNGFLSTPLPGFLPLIETASAPGVPVPGLLPVCRAPIIPAKTLAIDVDSGWIYWPVDTGGWMDALAAHPGFHADENEISESGSFPVRKGLPLARYENPGEESILSSPEVRKILENPPGWRAINLVCWSVETISGRPWYLSALWYLLWQRRLKRAPELTNNNK